MNMAWIDWLIIVVIYLGLVVVGIASRKYMKGVSGFLVAGRSMGKYLGYATGNAADVGAVAVIASMESAYLGGPKILMFGIIGLGTGIYIGKTGFVVRRLRETRIMTLPQLFEMRYSKGVRVTAGVICFLSGVLNMGIFPVLTGYFFTHFAGLPSHFSLIGIMLPTVPVLTAFLIGAAITFAFLGGQVSVIVTDFIQSIMMGIIFIMIGYCVYQVVAWQSVQEAILNAKNAEELLNPFSKRGDFNYLYLLMLVVGQIFGTAAWAPGIQKITSAKSPEEARVIMLLKNLRLFSFSGIYFCGLAVFAVMTLPTFADFGLAESVSGIDEAFRDKMLGPVLLAKVLPVGLMGLLFAGMMSAFISTNDSYMLTWAGVFVQDVILPLRKKPLSQKAHVWLLRSAVLFVGISIYILGVTYKPHTPIVIYQQLTGAIYIAGAGTIIILGLYWKRGNSYGASSALTIGAIIPIVSYILEKQLGESYTITAVQSALIAYGAAMATYIIVSLLTPNPHFDLNKMLNRAPGAKKKL